MTTNFPELLRVLSQAEVEFIIVGGAAAIAHGSATLTQDLDIVYNRDTKNIERVVAALTDYSPYLRGAPPGLPFDWSARTIRNGLNFTLSTSLGAIDILGEIAGGGSYEDLLPNSSNIELYGTKCLCLKLEKLIETKRAAGRPKDLNAIAELEALLEESEKT
jgi:predicted nucleotidyltransferase